MLSPLTLISDQETKKNHMPLNYMHWLPKWCCFAIGQKQQSSYWSPRESCICSDLLLHYDPKNRVSWSRCSRIWKPFWVGICNLLSLVLIWERSVKFCGICQPLGGKGWCLGPVFLILNSAQHVVQGKSTSPEVTRWLQNKSKKAKQILTCQFSCL